MSTRVRRAFSLVEILVTVAILTIIAAIILPRYLRGGPKTSTGRSLQDEAPVQRAHGVECANALNQIRQAYTMATSADEEHRPQSLADLKSYGISDKMTICPVGKVPYVFNSATGQVQCPYPGHGKF